MFLEDGVLLLELVGLLPELLQLNLLRLVVLEKLLGEDRNVDGVAVANDTGRIAMPPFKEFSFRFFHGLIVHNLHIVPGKSRVLFKRKYI